MEIKNFEWNQIPGTTNLRMFPMIDVSQIFCSNTYLIETPWQIIIIDPGLDIRRIDRTLKMIEDLLAQCEKPVFIFLTHCHGDHSGEIEKLYQGISGKKFIFAHEYGIEALLKKKLDFLQTAILDINPPHINESSKFLYRDNESEPRGECISIIDLPEYKIHRFIPESKENIDLKYLEISYFDDKIIVYHTPGHSPDSLCFQIGEALFIGDLPFASNPLVAGIVGWDQKNLIKSLNHILHLLGREKLNYFFAGHLDPLDTATLTKILQRNLKDGMTYGDLYTLDGNRVKKLIEYSGLLLQEAKKIFAIISGRLMRASYYLESLGENEEAKRLESLIDFQSIDKFISDFSDFADEYVRSRSNSILFATKGLVFVKKIEKIFNREALKDLIDERLLNRASRLLNDFFNSARGIKFHADLTVENMNDIVCEVINSVNSPESQEDKLFSLVENKDLFIKELGRRFAHVPILENINLNFTPDKNLPAIALPKQQLTNIINLLAEQIASCGARAIQFKTSTENQNICLELIGHSGSKNIIFPEDKRDFISFSIADIGGIFSIKQTSGEIFCLIKYPLAEKL